MRGKRCRRLRMRKREIRESNLCTLDRNGLTRVKEIEMKGFIEVRVFEDNSRVLVNVNSILYVFSDTDFKSPMSHAVLFFGHVQNGRESRVSVVECVESYDTVRMLIADAIGD